MQGTVPRGTLKIHQDCLNEVVKRLLLGNYVPREAFDSAKLVL